jgi:UPF0755 protein
VKKLIALVVVILIAGIGASRVYDWWSYNVNTPVSATSQPVPFTIDQGEVPSAVAQALADKGLIRNKDIFEWYLRLTGAGSSFQAGSFVLNRNMNIAQIVDALQKANPNQKVVTIPEGYPLKFQADFVEKAWPGMGKQYLVAAASPTWRPQYDFLSSVPGNANPPLEGYLFPDTYKVDPVLGVNGLIKQQLDQFGTVFSPDLRSAISQATGARPAETVQNIVILASMVEREADRDPDRGNVCSVYYNRLANGMKLGVDATLLYGLGRLTPEPTAAELAMTTPWNTRTHAGLPPGPISNPGKAALLACINPPKTNFLYYFTDPSGTTHFETNDADFERDKHKYGVD